MVPNTFTRSLFVVPNTFTRCLFVVWMAFFPDGEFSSLFFAKCAVLAFSSLPQSEPLRRQYPLMLVMLYSLYVVSFCVHCQRNEYSTQHLVAMASLTHPLALNSFLVAISIFNELEDLGQWGRFIASYRNSAAGVHLFLSGCETSPGPYGHCDCSRCQLRLLKASPDDDVRSSDRYIFRWADFQ
ncbi:hypothetical protein MIND_00080600 [Mycena indigotica]|uniref:Uncharacterized protein n=1 Tax=Mycena indigotica TaxID=2126181 RepID=A0A8H6TDZ6_9AGAR|nr:uncharacterized protein MIND_00080600 [Mycena indigotica]KAF7315651.1 hypothetical protein MIND_00080600 [Mycena indigotica]